MPLELSERIAQLFGIVTFEHRAINQTGTLVVRARRSAMMRRKSA